MEHTPSPELVLSRDWIRPSLGVYLFCLQQLLWNKYTYHFDEILHWYSAIVHCAYHAAKIHTASRGGGSWPVGTIPGGGPRHEHQKNWMRSWGRSVLNSPAQPIVQPTPQCGCMDRLRSTATIFIAIASSTTAAIVKPATRMWLAEGWCLCDPEKIDERNARRLNLAYVFSLHSFFGYEQISSQKC